MRTVLIVGDAHTLPDRESTMLERSEVAVIGATHVDAAAIASERGADIAIVDPHAPGVDAAASCAVLRARGREGIRVLLVAAPAEQDRFAGAGADGFVSRPLTTARLLDAVRRYAPLPERAEVRVPFAVKVDFARAGVEASGYAHDLTSAGLFLVTREPLAPGDEIEIAFALPTTEAHAIRTRARVVRAGDVGSGTHGVVGFGLAFVELAAKDHIEITRWLREKGSA